MSKIFYDHLIVFEEIETVIKEVATEPSEKEELWKLVDDIVHHKVMIAILDRLPIEHHEEFLNSFHELPHHDSHIHYLNQRISVEVDEDIERIIKKEVQNLEKDLIGEIKKLQKK
jgi:hypothetical protein